MDNNISEQLRDIKPLLEIPDSTYYIYWGAIILLVVLLVVVVFFIVKKLWDARKINLEKGYLEAMNNIDWKDSKQSAYDATYYGRLLATDVRRKELFSQLEPMLAAYKYKKVVDDIDDATKKQFNLYVQVANESV